MSKALEALRLLAKAAGHEDGSSLGDFVYDIRERVVDDLPEGMSSWDHPQVKAWIEGCSLAREALAEGA